MAYATIIDNLQDFVLSGRDIDIEHSIIANATLDEFWSLLYHFVNVNCFGSLILMLENEQD